MSDPLASRPTGDEVRLGGFADRVPLERALAWIDRHATPLGAVEIDVAEAAGRVAALTVTARVQLPPESRAGDDGHAVRASDTFGASAYGPALLPLVPFGPALPAGAAMRVSSGGALPRGADAVLGLDAAQPAGELLEVIAPVAHGSGVEAAGQQLGAGAAIVASGRRLRPDDAALLAAAGVERLAVVARPRVRLVVAGPKGGRDVHAPMLRALVERDGGTVERGGGAGSLRDVLARPDADVVLATGRTGGGPDDDAPSVLAELGDLAIHGVALRPGGSVALGLTARTPVVLLPGDPLACACAYELLAGRLVRRLGGRDARLPHETLEVEVSRKIVSTVGFVDVCQVRRIGGRIEPVGVVEFGGLGAAVRSDGFVVVPAPLEGWPPGARVTVHLY